MAAWAAVGCAPSAFLARRIIEPPNRVPDFVKPEGRVTLRWPRGIFERFPGGTNRVGPDGVPIHWVCIEPSDYGMQTHLTPRSHARRPGADIRFEFRLPTNGLPEPRPARGTVFVLHGYGMDLETMFPWGVYLAEAGWRAFLVDLRGHGLSGGDRVGFGTMETPDLIELRRRLEADGRCEGPVLALGHSLGGAIALRWAALDSELTGAVALAPYARFETAAERLRHEYARWIPPGWVRRATRRVPTLLGTSPESMNPADVLRARETRNLIVMAQDDRVAPPEDGQILRNALGQGSAWLIVGSATHETMPFVFDQHGNVIREWLSSAAAASGPHASSVVGTGGSP